MMMMMMMIKFSIFIHQVMGEIQQKQIWKRKIKL